MHGLMFAGLLMVAVPQTLATGVRETAPQRPFPAPDPNAPPVIDIALRMIRVAPGGSSIARSAVRAEEPAFVYAGLGPCIVGASALDPAHEHSMTWRASGRVRSVERGIAVADVEWQRLDYRAAEPAAGPLVRTTLTLPLGERVAVDFVDVSGSVCRMDGLIFEIGIAPDHGFRLAMSGEGRAGTAAGATGAASGGGGGRGGGGVGRRLTPAELETQAARLLRGAEAARAASVVTRPMPPRQYDVDVWLVPEAAGTSSVPALAQRQTQVIGGTGGRFDWLPIPFETANRSVGVEISALVIPIDGERLIVAISRHVTSDGASPVSAGWIKAVPLPKASDVLSFEIPAPDAAESAILPRQGFGLRVRIAPR